LIIYINLEMNKFILFFLLASISYSQNNLNDKGERNGVWIGYHENGQVKYQGSFSNGKEVGVFNYYNYDGDLVIKLNYIQVDSSDATLYYNNGFMKAKGQYVNKQKEGLWTYFDMDGSLNGEERFVNNKLQGNFVTDHHHNPSFYYDVFSVMPVATCQIKRYDKEQVWIHKTG